MKNKTLAKSVCTVGEFDDLKTKTIYEELN